MKRCKPTLMLMALLTAFLVFTGCNTMQSAQKAEPVKEDMSWVFHDLVEADFVKAHITVPMDPSVMVIDSRPYKPKYVKGHIPGSVSIPHTEFDKKVSMLPENKETLLIYYCGGLKCKLSHKSAAKAEKLGYKNVKVYAKGYPDWLAAGNYGAVSAEFVAGQIAENNAVIVDSRPKKPKYDKGHIPSAVSIPFSQFDKFSGKLPRDTDTPVIFYCGGLKCKLSHKSAAKAMEMGYSRVYVYDQGYPDWVAHYGASGQAVQVAAGEVEGSIDLNRFKKILKESPDSIMLIDVRDPDEFAKGSFKTAVNIPVETLEPKIMDLPDTKPIVYVCSTGARSGEAYYMTLDVRESLKDVYYVEAQIDYNADGSYEIKKTP